MYTICKNICLFAIAVYKSDTWSKQSIHVPIYIALLSSSLYKNKHILTQLPRDILVYLWWYWLWWCAVQPHFNKWPVIRCKWWTIYLTSKMVIHQYRTLFILKCSHNIYTFLQYKNIYTYDEQSTVNNCFDFIWARAFF